MKGIDIMAKLFVEKKHKNKSGEEKVIKYRVDADFVPQKIDEICEDFIQNYCIANGKEDWLDNQYESKEIFEVKAEKRKYKGVVYYKGQKFEADKSFISIRKDFAKEFFGITKKGEENITGRKKWEQKKKDANKKK